MTFGEYQSLIAFKQLPFHMRGDPRCNGILGLVKPVEAVRECAAVEEAVSCLGEPHLAPRGAIRHYRGPGESVVMVYFGERKAVAAE